ncbi:MAG: sigma-54-dependent Fis family transcriptional regulator [Candidatus Aureabacteria bacterium]|nr:sigma-54-dependent Fis family transcriptional regulator [Candidatus Auribacterota bacterium]
MIEFSQILTANEKFLSVIKVAKKISTSDISVLITGENGTGKNLLAMAIHDNSTRKSGPFVSVNCSAIPESLLESELFGHDKGAFTGAYAKRKGKFELAHKGTLFLDEIGDMNLSAQAKILQAIETKQFIRVGGEEVVNVDVRVVSATNQNLIEKVETNSFRMDLYYRIREITMEIPPLRERKEDIPILLESFIKQFSTDFGKKIKGISNVALNFLVNHDWKGNVRELRNVVRTAVALCEKDMIWLEDIPLRLELGNEKSSTEKILTMESFSLNDMEKTHILRTLQHCRWNKSKAARLLQISRPRLNRKILEYDLKKPDKKNNPRHMS